MTAMRVLFLGDLVGNCGRDAVLQSVPKLRRELSLDYVVVNGENVSGGRGILPAVADEIFLCGVDIISGGNHSFQHREAGAHEVLIASAARWALMHESNGPEPSLDQLVGRLSPVDLVLVEGFKASAHPKIEVYREGVARDGRSRAPFWPGRQDVVAVASDSTLEGCTVPVLNLDRPDEIVAWSLRFLELNDAVQPGP